MVSAGRACARESVLVDALTEKIKHSPESQTTTGSRDEETPHAGIGENLQETASPELVRQQYHMKGNNSSMLMGSPSPLCSAAKEVQAVEQRKAAIERVGRAATQFCGELERRSAELKAQGRVHTMPLPDLTNGGLSRSMFGSEPGIASYMLDHKDNPMSTTTCYSKENAVVIFDWDDTLFPTWHVVNVVNPCIPADVSDGPLDNDSPFFQMLETHARMVERVLRIARSMSRVAIVTLAGRPWVTASAAKYLPGLDLEDLLDELDIDVYYAREAVNRTTKHRAFGQTDEGVNPFVVAKRLAMSKCLRRLYRTSGSGWNVVSIGDSLIEKEAISEVLWCIGPSQKTNLCKTVKLFGDPSAKDLGMQLQLVAGWLQKIINHDTDMDVDLSVSNCDYAQLGERDKVARRHTVSVIMQDSGDLQ